MRATRATLSLVSLAFASGAFAQSTSTTMDMGGGMTHVDTMGPNGAMSSSNCMNMGGNLISCQTMDMSRPQRTYTEPEASEPEPSYSPPYVSRWPMPTIAVPPASSDSRTVAMPTPAAPVAQSNKPITPAPMSLISVRLIPIPDLAKDQGRTKPEANKAPNGRVTSVKVV